MSTTLIIEILIGLVLCAYGWIFMSIVKRIGNLEDKYCKMNEKFDSSHLEIKQALAKIQADLEWLKKK